MAELVDWLGDGKDTPEAETPHILRLQDGNTYCLRFIGAPVRFYRFFVSNRSALCDESVRQTIKKAFSLEPLLRYAATALLRNDVGEYTCGRPYILEFSQRNYNDFCRLGRKYNSPSGTTLSCDFNLSVDGCGLGTKIRITAVAGCPLTESEKVGVRGRLYDLEQLFRGSSAAEVAKLLRLNETLLKNPKMR